jgi:hypothetical protein
LKTRRFLKKIFWFFHLAFTLLVSDLSVSEAKIENCNGNDLIKNNFNIRQVPKY